MLLAASSGHSRFFGTTIKKTRKKKQEFVTTAAQNSAAAVLSMLNHMNLEWLNGLKFAAPSSSKMAGVYSKSNFCLQHKAKTDQKNGCHTAHKSIWVPLFIFSSIPHVSMANDWSSPGYNVRTRPAVAPPGWPSWAPGISEEIKFGFKMRIL